MPGTMTRNREPEGSASTDKAATPGGRAWPVVLAFVVVIVGAALAMNGLGGSGELVPTVDDAAPATGADGGGDGAGGAATDAIEVSMTDFAFAPASLELDAGTHTFEIVNEGIAPHQWALSVVGEHGEHIADTGQLLAGETATLTVDLDAGVYEFACHVPGHYDAGMVGELRVAGADGTVPETAADPSSDGEADGASDVEHDDAMPHGHDDGAMADHDQAASADGAGQAGAADVVEVSMTDFAYTPASLELPAGTYTFLITNDGQVPHEWALAEAGEHHGHGATTPQLAAGESHELTVELTPGEYSYMCHIEGHLEAGMEGMLTVTG